MRITRAAASACARISEGARRILRAFFGLGTRLLTGRILRNRRSSGKEGNQLRRESIYAPLARTMTSARRHTAVRTV